MLLIFLIILVILVRIAIHVSRKKKSKVVRFIGPRGTGKTATINALTGLSYMTVPTLESYSVVHKQTIIYDIIEKNGDFFEKYSIDNTSDLYFFFIRNFKDLDQFPATKDFNLRFVYYGLLEEKEASRRNIIVLNENPREIENYLV